MTSRFSVHLKTTMQQAIAENLTEIHSFGTVLMDACIVENNQV